MAKTKAKAAPKKVATKAATPAPTHARGADEAAAWIAGRKLSTAGKARWYVEIALPIDDVPHPDVYSGDTDTRFMLKVYGDEWGLLFVHKGKTSHVRRVTEDFVNGSDGHKLLKEMPQLADIGAFIKSLEAKHKIAWRRELVHVRSNLAGAKAAIRDWLAAI
jgi:hypothetical protein